VTPGTHAICEVIRWASAALHDVDDEAVGLRLHDVERGEGTAGRSDRRGDDAGNVDRGWGDRPHDKGVTGRRGLN
jgi:hypothetical protein